MHGCKKCNTITAVLILLAGLGFVLKDLNMWGFFGLNWWSVIFVVIGVTCLAMGSCKDCQKKMNGSSKGK